MYSSSIKYATRHDYSRVNRTMFLRCLIVMIIIMHGSVCIYLILQFVFVYCIIKFGTVYDLPFTAFLCFT